MTLNPTLKQIGRIAGKIGLSILWLSFSAQFAGRYGVQAQAQGLVVLVPGLIAIWYPGLSFRSRLVVAGIGVASGTFVLALAHAVSASADSIHTAAWSFGILSTASWWTGLAASVWAARRATPGQRRFLERFGLGASQPLRRDPRKE